MEIVTDSPARGNENGVWHLERGMGNGKGQERFWWGLKRSLKEADNSGTIPRYGSPRIDSQNK